MNRENKRKQYQKGYFKQNPCNDVFTCKECGRLVLPEFAGTNHRNHCPNCLTSLHIDNQPGDRLAIVAAIWSLLGFGFVKMENGRLSIVVNVVER